VYGQIGQREIQTKNMSALISSSDLGLNQKKNIRNYLVLENWRDVNTDIRFIDVNQDINV